jgi:hypothetical protein
VKAILIAALLLPTPAIAFQGDWIDRATQIVHPRKPEVRSYRKVVKPSKPKPAKVYPPHNDHIRVCLPTIRVVGSQWVTEKGAEESAQKAWMEKARWLYGESAMDLTAAQDYAKRCSRSSIGEVAGQTQHRCEVEAVPCRPRFEK